MSAMPFTIRPSGPALAPARGASARSASRTVHVTGRESAAWQRRERQLGSVARVATPSDDRTFRFAVDPSNLRRARLNIRAKAVSGGEPSPPGSSSSESAGARLLAAERRLLDLFIPGKDPPKASAVAMLREEIDLLRKHASAEAEENRAAASQASAQAALSPEELIKQKSEEMNRIMQENAKLREKAAAKAMSGLSDAEKAEVERLKAENDKLRLKAEAVAKSVAPPRPAAAAPPPPAAKAAPASAAMAAREAAVEDARREQEEAEALARKFAAERDANLAKQGADEAMLADLEARVRGDLAGLGELVEDAPAPAAPPPPPPAATAPPPAPEPVVDEDDAIAEKEAMDLIERIQAQAAAKANEAIAYAEATAPDKELTAKQKAMAAEVTRMKEENAKLKAMAEAAANPKAAPAAAPANPEDPRARAAADIAAQAAQAKKEAEAANLKAGADKLSAAQAAHAAAAGAAVAAAAEERALSAKLEVDAKNKAESHKQKAQAEAALAAAQAKAKKDSEELARLAEEKKRMEKLKAEAKIKEEKEILALEEENRKLKAMADKVAAKKAAEKAAIEAEEAKAAAEELASAEAAEAMAAAAAEAKAAMAAAAQAAADAAAEPAAAAPDAIPEGEDPEVTAKKAKQAALQAKMAAIMEENAELREKSQASKEGAAAPAAPAAAAPPPPAPKTAPPAAPVDDAQAEAMRAMIRESNAKAQAKAEAEAGPPQEVLSKSAAPSPTSSAPTTPAPDAPVDDGAAEAAQAEATAKAEAAKEAADAAAAEANERKKASDASAAAARAEAEAGAAEAKAAAEAAEIASLQKERAQLEALKAQQEAQMAQKAEEVKAMTTMGASAANAKSAAEAAAAAAASQDAASQASFEDAEAAAKAKAAAEAKAAADAEAAAAAAAAEQDAIIAAAEEAEKAAANRALDAAKAAKERAEAPLLAKANEEADSLTNGSFREDALPHATLGDKLVFTYPANPVAGKKAKVFFNRGRSSTLFDRPEIRINLGYNEWNLKPVFEGSLKPTSLPKSQSVDWWCIDIDVPEETYCLEYVFSDDQGTFENNGAKNFKADIIGGMCKQEFAMFLEQAEIERIEREAREAAMTKEEEEKAEYDKLKEECMKRATQDVMGGLAEAKNCASQPKQPKRWRTVPETPVPGEKVTIYYNKCHTPMHGRQQCNGTIGSNLWQAKAEVPSTPCPSEKEAPSTPAAFQFTDEQMALFSPEQQAVLKKQFAAEEAAAAEGGEEFFLLPWGRVKKDMDKDDWVFFDYEVPLTSVLVSFVVSDNGTWDNNDRNDYHMAVAEAKGQSDDSAPKIKARYEELVKELDEQRAKDAAAAAERAKRADEMRAKSLAVFRQQQAEIIYTEPSDPVAGDEVTVFYNPNKTVLSGCPTVFANFAFNRWTHPNAPPPVELEAAASKPGYLTCTLKVPKDAYVLDAVFMNAEEDATIYDNRGGIDYHIPTVGATKREKPLHIVNIAVEMAPICKVGGLGDVVTSISRAITDEGHKVECIVPKYDVINYGKVKNMREIEGFQWGGTYNHVWHGIVEDVDTYFIDPDNGFFKIGIIYGADWLEIPMMDAERFGFFSRAALEFLLQSGRQPDILHCHDWSTADIAKCYWDDYHPYGLSKPRIAFTIHNLGFGEEAIQEAMTYSQVATTVSPTYAREISHEWAIVDNLSKFHGIRNGIDPDIWDPSNDEMLPVQYTDENVAEGKAAAKQALRQRMGLREIDAPVIGVVTRLTAQKGVELIKHGIYTALERGCQVVLLGSAFDPLMTEEFNQMADSLGNSYYGMAKLQFSYDEPLSHLIYAGSDMLLVPSIFEPCGLSQLVAMRYGTVPIVRQTGGLYDTVFDCDHDKDRAAAESCEVNGFSFSGADPEGMDYALNRAIDAWYNDRKWYASLQASNMRQDWTWNRPAMDYVELYRAALKD